MPRFIVLLLWFNDPDKVITENYMTSPIPESSHNVYFLTKSLSSPMTILVSFLCFTHFIWNIFLQVFVYFLSTAFLQDAETLAKDSYIVHRCRYIFHLPWTMLGVSVRVTLLYMYPLLTTAPMQTYTCTDTDTKYPGPVFTKKSKMRIRLRIKLIFPITCSKSP